MANKLIITAITAVISLGSGTIQANATDQPTSTMGGEIEGLEKCYGIVRAGMNDCGTASHNCSGSAKIDNDKREWVYVPTGLCTRIVGGSKTPTDKKT